MRAGFVLPIVAFVYAGATIVVFADLHGSHTTYAAQSQVATVAAFAAGGGLLASGTMLRSGSAGVAAIVAGLAWLAQIWAGWFEGLPLVRILGAAASAFVLPAIAQVALRGRAVLAGYAVTAVLVVARTLIYDPFLDLYCWRTCSRENPLLLHPWPHAAAALDLALAAFAVVFGLAAAGLAAVAVARMSPVARRTGGVVPLWCAVALAAWAVAEGVRLAGPPQSAGAPLHQAAFFV
ncbi:hypothetical protein ACIBH1_12070 [Nonomuraea sp. NPDC050663]|uniref:hypothetical protein n=1 Tax=Nonomuraea sp. NPDC050663 TaxID=3364370 RepID=UPI0037B1D55F